jgi:hypothetical protein
VYRGEGRAAGSKEALSHLSVTLQRSSRSTIDIDNDSIWVTGEINSDVDLDLGHFFVDLFLRDSTARSQFLLSLGSMKDENGKELTFFSALLDLMNGFSFAEIEVTSSKNENSRL